MGRAPSGTAWPRLQSLSDPQAITVLSRADPRRVFGRPGLEGAIKAVACVVDESEVGRFGDLALRGGDQEVGLLGDDRPMLGRRGARFQCDAQQPQQCRDDGRFLRPRSGGSVRCPA